MKEMMPRIVLGNPLNRATKMGPLVSREHLEKVEGYIEIGRKTLIAREYQTTNGWHTGSWTPQIWTVPVTRAGK